MIHRVAILGAGIGAKHANGFLANPERFQVTQICDLDEERGAELAAKTGAQSGIDIATVLSDPDVDIVDICLPPFLHTKVTREALAAGKHVICEKPISGSLRDADALLDLENRSGKRVFPVFQYRHGRAFSAIGALRRAGLLGAPRVAALETHWNRGTDYYATPWRGTWDHELGGAILSHAIHIHDLIGTLFDPIRSVSAMLGTLINPVETEDCAALAFRTDSGALVTSSVSLGSARDETRLRLVYEHATVESARIPYAPGQADWTFQARNPENRGEIDTVVAAASANQAEGFAGFLRSVSDVLDGKAGSVATLHDGVTSIELASAIYLSDRTGHRIDLPLDRSLPICGGLRP